MSFLRLNPSVGSHCHQDKDHCGSSGAAQPGFHLPECLLHHRPSRLPATRKPWRFPASVCVMFPFLEFFPCPHQLPPRQKEQTPGHFIQCYCLRKPPFLCMVRLLSDTLSPHALLSLQCFSRPFNYTLVIR